jgi:hypothetical protein
MARRLLLALGPVQLRNTEVKTMFDMTTRSAVSRATMLALAAGLATVLACSTATSTAPAAPARTSAMPSLAGTWKLGAADDILPDGTRTPTFGPDPQGRLMIDEAGRYSLQIFRSHRAKFAANDKRKATAEEYQAAVIGMSSHIGHCAIDPSTQTITFRIELASYPNWDGTAQHRRFTLSGDELSYEVPAAASADGVARLSVWRRVREP